MDILRNTLIIAQDFQLFVAYCLAQAGVTVTRNVDFGIASISRKPSFTIVALTRRVTIMMDNGSRTWVMRVSLDSRTTMSGSTTAAEQVLDYVIQVCIMFIIFYVL